MLSPQPAAPGSYYACLVVYPAKHAGPRSPREDIRAFAMPSRKARIDKLYMNSPMTA